MKPWKITLGLGAACAACCAIPLIAAAGGLAAFASSLLACADEFLPLAAILLLLALGAIGFGWWKRRQSQRKASCGCSTSCTTGASDACR